MHILKKLFNVVSLLIFLESLGALYYFLMIDIGMSAQTLHLTLRILPVLGLILGFFGNKGIFRNIVFTANLLFVTFIIFIPYIVRIYFWNQP